MNNSDIAKIFKAFCDERRLEIIELLQDNEKCACKLLEELNISQPTLSHHMKILCQSEIVEFRKEGRWTHYRINKKGIERAKKILQSMS